MLFFTSEKKTLKLITNRVSFFVLPIKASHDSESSHQDIFSNLYKGGVFSRDVQCLLYGTPPNWCKCKLTGVSFTRLLPPFKIRVSRCILVKKCVAEVPDMNPKNGSFSLGPSRPQGSNFWGHCAHVPYLKNSSQKPVFKLDSVFYDTVDGWWFRHPKAKPPFGWWYIKPCK